MTDTPDRILRINTVLDMTGLSRSTMYRKIAERCAGWRQSAITDWLQNPMFYEAG